VSNGLKLLAYVPTLRQSMPPTVLKNGRTDDSRWIQTFYREFGFPYFDQGYVSLDLGRDTQMTDAIRKHITGYAIADEQGHVVQTYTDLGFASRARDGATLQIVPQVIAEPEPSAIGQ